MPHRRKRPAGEYRAPSGDFTATVPQSADQIALVTACVRIDLSVEHSDDHHDRHELFALDDVPDGARVVVWVGHRTWLWDSTALLLHRQAKRLLIELQGSPRANIRRWLDAVRTGQIELVI
jgi:hypothetical protein